MQGARQREVEASLKFLKISSTLLVYMGTEYECLL